mmetsp:Transcript_20546/g.57008  ORF Transcript_20546/g.57008 Transcript_20546/m.57008 type:complete len:108 (-) Transcript_20546:1806-2129(-)
MHRIRTMNPTRRYRFVHCNLSDCSKSYITDATCHTNIASVLRNDYAKAISKSTVSTTRIWNRQCISSQQATATRVDLVEPCLFLFVSSFLGGMLQAMRASSTNKPDN